MLAALHRVNTPKVCGTRATRKHQHMCGKRKGGRMFVCVAEHLPVEVAGKAVLLHLAGAELREAVRDAAADGLRLVELGVRANVQQVFA